MRLARTLGATLLVCNLIFSVAAGSDMGPESVRMKDAQAFARTLVQAAMPGKPIGKLQIVRNTEANAIPWVCSLELATQPRIIASVAAETPERACYLAVERASKVKAKRGPNL